MNTPTKPQQAVGRPPQDAMIRPQNLARARQILFGTKFEDLDRRLSSIEETVNRDLDRLQAEQRSRNEVMERLIKDQVAQAVERLKADRVAVNAATAAVEAGLNAKISGVESRVSTLDERVAEREAALRAQVTSETNTLRDEVARAQTELQQRVDATLQALDSGKTDRTQIAGLLRDVASRLAGEEDEMIDLGFAVDLEGDDDPS